MSTGNSLPQALPFKELPYGGIEVNLNGLSNPSTGIFSAQLQSTVEHARSIGKTSIHLHVSKGHHILLPIPHEMI